MLVVLFFTVATQTVDQFLARAARASGLPTQSLPKGLVYLSQLLASCSRVNNMQEGGFQQGHDHGGCCGGGCCGGGAAVVVCILLCFLFLVTRLEASAVHKYEEDDAEEGRTSEKEIHAPFDDRSAAEMAIVGEKEHHERTTDISKKDVPRMYFER